VLVVYGTRPEAIKLAPVVLALQRDASFQPIVCITGQHQEMVDELNEVFGIIPDFDLALQRDRQTLTHVTTAVLDGLEGVLDRSNPTAMVVQGDTSSAFAATLAAFYRHVPVAHVEAGLRTHDLAAPFPEEGNRRLIAQLAALHLAPTAAARRNLLAEGIDDGQVVVTGNTGIDALRLVAAATPTPVATDGRRLVLVTAHRRESWDGGLRAVARAVRRLADERDDVEFVFAVHPNPVAREAVLPLIARHEHITVRDALPYREFVSLLQRAHVALTDSGGVQEEAPSFGTPVLVMRDKTERSEAIDAGVAKLVGTDEDRLVAEVTAVLDDDDAHARMAAIENPYGDGRAAERTVASLRWLLLGGPTPEPFVP
jgi:UDP-N-acetylglucosamine 2-epimerase (non-hydrolysing)